MLSAPHIPFQDFWRYINLYVCISEENSDKLKPISQTISWLIFVADVCPSPCVACYRQAPDAIAACAANVDRKSYRTVMFCDVIRRHALALLLCYACAANAHFNLYMNETETWRLLGKSVR